MHAKLETLPSTSLNLRIPSSRSLWAVTHGKFTRLKPRKWTLSDPPIRASCQSLSAHRTSRSAWSLRRFDDPGLLCEHQASTALQPPLPYMPKGFRDIDDESESMQPLHSPSLTNSHSLASLTQPSQLSNNLNCIPTKRRDLHAMRLSCTAPQGHTCSIALAVHRPRLLYILPSDPGRNSELRPNRT